MRAIVTAMALIVGFALAGSPATAQVSEDDRASIRAVVQAQLDAFQADDWGLAFSFASPDIQRMFQSPDRFMAMVRQGYQPVYRPREVEFLDVVAVGEIPTQRVLLVGPDGTVVTAWYAMERQADGTWRIGGCVLERAPDLPI